MGCLVKDFRAKIDLDLLAEQLNLSPERQAWLDRTLLTGRFCPARSATGRYNQGNPSHSRP